MPQTKNALIRLKYLDRLLSDYYQEKEIPLRKACGNGLFT